ncbi:dethiobiotin synthase [Nitrosomonas sp.]|uniref:dethiobiotin synthase n=1 Tax=Nitrosomonas sp. TaxID=42353 RepID=UPI0020856B5D|nr:dethiobiotin synthase [Nitrosomonas sp.]GJL75179.1 MAG: ATP-dependent dethiobiotin synthetase BioD [Nitrosomonas sp.]
MTGSFFVTGTDTGIGKTFVSCLLLHAFAVQNKTVAGMKPIAAGKDNGKWLDVELLRAASNVDVPYEWMNPYALNSPVAPHIAARQEAVEIDLAKIHTAFHQLKKSAECIIVEGVGGFLVPVNERQDTSDLAKLLGLPVVLVVGMRLGCINHALLTQRAIQQIGLPLAGWVANCIDPGTLVLDENIAALRKRLDCPLLGVVPYAAMPNMEVLSQSINMSKLYGISV